jgi:hypothetical protein
MGIAFLVGFMIVLAVPLVLCLNAMGRQIRSDFERGDPDRIATDVQMQRKILLTVSAFVLVSVMLGHWMVGLTALLTGLAFLIPYWRNRPLAVADESAAD